MLSFLFPSVCPLCGKTLLEKGERICKSCGETIQFVKEPTCYSCGKPLSNPIKEYCKDCEEHPRNFERGMGLCIYEGPVITSLSAIKYNNKRKFSKFYIEEIRRRKRMELKKLSVDLVVPVPIHWKKKRTRGFNQAELFANGIGQIIGRPVALDLISRIHETKPQKQLNPAQRRRNLKNAFRGNYKVYKKLQYPKKVLVVDDIYTTGATAEAVTSVLKGLGVQEVYIFCVAVGRGFS